jgi:hypothetical protein
MKAIPTIYNGVQFRSRLEAKWAAFFDLLGWPWQYEPFDLDGWIPDFLLGADILIEVKPVVEYPHDIAAEINRSKVPSPYVCGIFGCVIRESFIGWAVMQGGCYGHLGVAKHSRTGRFGLCLDTNCEVDVITCDEYLNTESEWYDPAPKWNQAGNIVQWRSPVRSR